MVLIFVGGLNIEGDSDSYDFGVGMQRCMPLVYISTQFLFWLGSSFELIGSILIVLK